MVEPFFIVGPTAVGKTSLAVEVAERAGAEIVSADAFQVYEGLDLLTAKPSSADRRRVSHSLIGTVPLAQAYSVAQYLDDARASLQSISKRGRVAIVVGGSGLYVKALTHGLSPLPGAHPAIRSELEREDCLSLHDRLRTLDAPAAAIIDRQNKRRLVRAIEVCLVTGKRFSDFRTLWQSETMPNTGQGIFLTREKSELQARIELRTRQMFTHGVIDEVRAVPPAALSVTSSQVIGYAEIRLHLNGQISKADCQDRIMLATRRYAKRQKTWFRRIDHFLTLDLSQVFHHEQQIETLLQQFYLHVKRFSSRDEIEA